MTRLFAALRGRSIAIRLAAGIAILFVVSLVVFGATQALPGDAAQAILGDSAPASDVIALRERLGLNRPLVQQYGSWLGQALRGDFGYSLATSYYTGVKTPVTKVIGERFSNSLALLFLTMAIVIPLALALGIYTA